MAMAPGGRPIVCAQFLRRFEYHRHYVVRRVWLSCLGASGGFRGVSRSRKLQARLRVKIYLNFAISSSQSRSNSSSRSHLISIPRKIANLLRSDGDVTVFLFNPVLGVLRMLLVVVYYRNRCLLALHFRPADQQRRPQW